MVTYPGFYAVPGSMFPGEIWPGETLSGFGPTPPSTIWLWHSSVPDMAVPGMAVPGLVGTVAQSPLFLYLGHIAVYYLDYLDITTQKTLFAVPGNVYSMTPVNSRAGLTIPPPDNCWLTSTNKFAPRIVLRPRLKVIEAPPPALVTALDALFETKDSLAKARIHSANFHVFNAALPITEQPKGTPQEARVIKPAEPSAAALALAAARARSAELQALRARGDPVGC